MTVHHLGIDRDILHDSFDRDRAPVLTIDPGDTVVFRTLDSSWGKVGEWMHGIPAPSFVHDPAGSTDGHALSGPIAVHGAQPGDVLEVRIGTIRPGGWGHTYVAPAPHFGVPDKGGLGWTLDPDACVATDTDGLGFRVPLRPFMGVMGNAPSAPGRHSTTPPRRVGGNLDCRELVSGSTLWLPIEVEGALFSVGDGHGAQGDGEISITAIECPMDEVELTFALRDDFPLRMPEADTPAGYVTFGIAATLDEAVPIAVNGMLDHLERALGLERPRALALASVAVHLRVTQIVNETVGIHALLPPDAVLPHPT